MQVDPMSNSATCNWRVINRCTFSGNTEAGNTFLVNMQLCWENMDRAAKEFFQNLKLVWSIPAQMTGLLKIENSNLSNHSGRPVNDKERHGRVLVIIETLPANPVFLRQKKD